MVVPRRQSICDICGTTIESSARTRWEWTHTEAPLAITGSHEAVPWDEMKYDLPINQRNGEIAMQGAS